MNVSQMIVLVIKILHYVEKPETFVSHLISCGIYLFSPAIFDHISVIFKEKNEEVKWEE